MTGSPNVRSKGNDAFSDWRGLPSVMRGWASTRSCPYSMKDTERGGSLSSLASMDRARVEMPMSGKPHIRVPAPDRNAIVQEGLLPLRAINRRSPIGVFVGANLICDRGELAIRRHVEMVDLKLRVCCTAERRVTLCRCGRSQSRPKPGAPPPEFR